MSLRRTTLGEIFYAIPTCIRWLIGLCTLAWIGELVAVASAPEGAVSLFRLLALSWPGIVAWRLWQFVTYQFLHDVTTPLHLLFNMLTLWMFGRELEPRWGSWAFLRFYLICGVGGGVAHLLLTRLLMAGTVPSVVGASAAVLGILTAYGMIWPHRQVILFIFPMEARHLVLLTAVMNILWSWVPSNGIANLAHLGGMATAWLYLRQGWRLRQVFSLGGRIRMLSADWQRKRRREKFHVVDRDWERWLKDHDPEDRGTRH